MARNKTLLTSLLLLFAWMAQAQYANDWIDYNQSYYKIKVVEDGWYRVTAAELQAKGFPVASVPAARIQLLRRGEEVAINVNSSGGVLNYLEFYGLRNTGEGDTPLYIQPDAQPHEYHNLFTDTAAYFLTWKLTAENGKRITFSNLNDFSGLTPETYHLAENRTLETSTYASGLKFGTGASFTLSDYDYGEGWTGPFVNKGGNRQYNLSLPSVTTGPPPQLEVVLIGGNTLDHNVEIQVGPDQSNLRTIGQVQFSDRDFHRQTFDFANTDIRADGNLAVRVNVVGFEGAADRVSVALVRVVYPQQVSLAAGQNKTFQLRTLATTDRAYFRMTTTNAAGTEIYEASDPYNLVRLTKTNFSDRLEAVVPGPSTNRKVLAVTSTRTVADIDAVTFAMPNLSTADYLIITHPLLRQPASDGLDPVQAFVNYRASAAGGSYTSAVFSIFDVFNQFNYGDASPLAIAQLAAFAKDEGDPQALFLIGKGRLPDLNFYRNNNHSTVVNIPTYGSPGGDLMFSKDLGEQPLRPGLATGRLNAQNNEQVKAYVDKVKEMEAVPYNDLFRKNVLQLSGGQTASELTVFRSYLEQFEFVAEGDYLGGKATNYGKETSNAVEVIDVVDEINEGVGLVTFFGHASSTVTDIEIGSVGDGQFGYANQGKYPVFLVNGCNAGSIFGNALSFGEDWMHTANLGAVGFIAHADFASAGNLKRFTDIFYDKAFADEAFFGATLGELIKECAREYFARFGTGSLSRTQIFQTVLQGDPMVRVFAAQQPDYALTGERVWAEPFEGDLVQASLDSFKVNLIVHNYGRTVTDSLLVQINRTLPQGEVVTRFQKFLRPKYADTLVFTLYNEIGQMVTGTNMIDIFLDPLNETPELNEGNNFVNTAFEIYRGNTTHLYPPDYAISNSEQVDFLWQPTDILEPSRGYELQVDTSPTFSSPALKQFNVSGTRLLRQAVDFSADGLADTTVVYWRTRFSSPANPQEEEWQQTSFSIITDGTSGWGQFAPEQIDENQVTGVEHTGGGNWQFITTQAPVQVTTFGANYPGYSYADLVVLADGIDYLVTDNTFDPQCAANTINALVFDKESTVPYRPIPISGADVQNPLVCGRIPQMVYNFTQTNVLGANAYLETLIGNMSTGDYILLFNIGQVNYSLWDADVRAALEDVGINAGTIAALTDGQPFIALGRKGNTPGTAVVLVSDGSGTPITQQALTLIDEVTGTFTTGQIISRRIGPARAWESFTSRVIEEAEDNFDVSIVGVTPGGEEEDLFQFARIDNQDLAAVDALQYPWVKLRFQFADETNLTPPVLDYWQVLYQLPPEGMLFSDETSTDQLVEGQLATKDFAFYNYSQVDFSDSLDAIAVLRTPMGQSQQQTFRIDGPVAGDTVLFSTAVPTVGQGGINALTVRLTPNENEQYSLNNQLSLLDAVNVAADEANPILDVTFDGEYILNGDIVSPNPVVRVKLRDENPFLLKNDTTGLDVYLRRPCEGCDYTRVNFTEPNINFSPATETSSMEIQFEPGPLEDGAYSLRVQGRDASGNIAGSQPYQVDFEVISESSITHFYPYPNPFSTSTRFVFTLTGSEVPSKLKIQIMTISGRVVREINQDEIGPIKIGHNITQFAWDGTDEYGDQLANGVYFYRVILQGSSAMKHRATSADGAFKHGFGKLYILR